MNDETAPKRHAWELFLRAHARLMGCLGHELEERVSLPLSWYDVLFHLSRAPDHQMRLQDLGRSVLISKSGLTRRIDRMIEAGLVERRGCKTDRRGAFAVLTERGRDALLEAAPVHREGVTRYFLDQVMDEEALAMVSALERCLSSLESACLPPSAEESRVAAID